MDLQNVTLFPDQEHDVCQCCLSTKDLRSVNNPYVFNGKVEIYSRMLSTCFVELTFENGLICVECVRRLRDVSNFKQSVRTAQNYLKYRSNKSIKENVNIEKSLDFVNDGIDLDHSTNEDCFSEFKDNEETNMVIEELNNDSESSDEDFDLPTETPQRIFVKEKIDVGERRTLPYVLDNRDRKCEICHKEFSFFGELSRHMPEHYPNHICDICGKICATRKSLIFHAKTHTDVRLKCKMCEKTFKNKSNLNAHVKVQHKGEKILFRCSQCNEVLNTYNARIKHMAEKHGREDKSYKCTQCPCKYRLGSHLRAHVRRVHLQEKNHKCHTCGLSFFSRKNLEHHSALHSEEKNVCTICQRSYSRKETLRQHMIKSHNGENYIQ